MNISGLYEGYYEYGAGYTLPWFGERVKLTVRISENKGKITGLVTEEESDISVHHPAVIEGNWEGQVIQFTKRYTPDDDSKKDEFNPIDHSGYIDAENGCIYGDWFIKTFLQNEDGSTDEEPFYFQGIWFLKRIRD